jgi:hypothetical protein
MNLLRSLFYHSLFPTFGSGRIGCAYFDPVQRLIYILEDTPESSHFDLTKMGGRIQS